MALRAISRLDDFAFPEGAWDVRGWVVRTAMDDEKVGRVDDLLLGREGRLRYLDVDLGFLQKHILVPMARSRADRANETVWIEGVSKARLDEAPEYALDPETLDEGYERRLDAYFREGRPGEWGAVERHAGAPPRAEPDDAGPLDLRRMDAIEDEYRVAGDDPRGWKVVTGEGQTVGRVAGLLVEPGAMKARYLEVVVDEKGLDLEPVDRHVLLPSEHVRLDRSGKKVVASGLLAPDLGDYPQYVGLPVEHDLADHIDRVFSRVTGDEPRRPAPWSENADSADDAVARFYGGRRSQAEREEDLER